jgi:prophage antirepressor-like protein|nr:MAG TPA: repressor domain protein [Caudoviricetes sp.]
MVKQNEMQATSLQRFFEENSNVCIRAQVINGEPWFVAKDVCQALLLKNPRQAISALDEDEKGVISMDTLGGRQKMNAVTESGLYELISQSRKPEAKPFRKWVTKEVLPALRKTGIYASQGSLNRNGVEGIYYLGQKFYPYTDMLKALGYSTRSGSVAKRKRNYPACIIKLFGRNFITEDLIEQLEYDKKQEARRLELKNKQYKIDFKED